MKSAKKMHIGKTHNKYICPKLSVDSWKEQLKVNDDGRKERKDLYDKRKIMKEVTDKKYLGDIISDDGKNEKNIRERTNRSIGNITKIVSTLSERPYGKYYFRAYKTMTEGILIGGLLNNAESWINITQKNIEDLEKTELLLQRKVLSVTGNPSRVFIPVRFVLMKKRLQFLNYILREGYNYKS